MNFLDVLNMLKKEKGLNNHSLSIATGIPYTTIDGWYKKGYDRIKLTTLKTLCQYFDVSLDFLIDGESKTTGGSSIRGLACEHDNSGVALAESDIIKKYRALDEHGIEMVNMVLDAEHKRCTAQPKMQIRAARSGVIRTEPLPIEYIEGSDTSDLKSE